MNWRVRWDDIMFGTMENDRKMRRQGSNLSLTRVGQSEFSLFSKKKKE